MSEVPRSAMLAPHVGLCPADGVEVFNQSLQHALGNLEIFVDSLPEGHRHIDELDRVGLELPYQALHAARVLVRRHREEPFQLIICNGVHGWPPSLTRLGVPLVQVYHLTMAGVGGSSASAWRAPRTPPREMCGRWVGSRTPTCPGGIRPPISSFSPPAMKGSAFPRSKPSRAVSRWS